MRNYTLMTSRESALSIEIAQLNKCLSLVLCRDLELRMDYFDRSSLRIDFKFQKEKGKRVDKQRLRFEYHIPDRR